MTAIGRLLLVSGAVVDQMVVEVETFFDVVRSRELKSRLHAVQD